jgi:hypothetical protein
LDKFDGAAAAYSLRKLREDFGQQGAAGPDLSLTNNGVTQSAPLVGSRSGDYDSSNSEYHGGTQYSAFDLGGVDMYVSAWVEPDNTIEKMEVWNSQGSNKEGFIVRASQGVWEFFIGTGSVFARLIGPTYTAGTIYFVEAWLAGGTMNLRIDDGSIDTTSTSVGSGSGTAAVGAGDTNSTRFFDGRIDNVAVENAPQGELNFPSRSTDLYNGGAGREWSWIKNNVDLSHLQFFADYENYTAGSDLPNRYDNNSGITSLSANNSPGIVAPPTGSAGSFDGSSNLDGVSGDDVEPESAYTIEGWVNLDRLASNINSDQIIAGTLELPSSSGWELVNHKKGDFRIQQRDAADGDYNRVGGGTPQTGVWAHVVGTWDGSTIRVYVDDVEVGNGSAGGITNSAKDFHIGSRQGGSYLDGTIGPVRFWNGRALTSSEISTLYNNGDGLRLSEIESSHPALLDDLVAAYEFDDAGNLGNDSFVLDGPVVRVRRGSDNVEREVGFDGDTVDTQALTDFANGGDVYVVTWYDQESNRDFSQTTQSEQPIIVDNGTVVSGNASSGMEYDGSDDNLALSESIVGGLQEATIMVWIKVISKTNDFPSVLLDGESGRKENMNMFVDITDDKWGYNAEDGNQVIFNERATPYSTGQWFHIAFAYDPDDKAEFFINGTKQASTTPSITFSTIRENTKEVRIANRLNGVEDENNAVYEDVIFFDKALTESEVQSIYDKTK